MPLTVVDGNGVKQQILTAADIIAALAAPVLPAGAASDAKLAQIVTALGTPAQAGGAVSISGTPTFSIGSGGLGTSANPLYTAGGGGGSVPTGPAGTPNAAVLSVQGITGGTAITITASSLPLPTGAAKSTDIASVVTALGSPLQAGGSVTLAGTPAVTISGTPTVTVSGVATAANQSTANTSLAGILTAVTGTLAISAASLPLPSGAATATGVAAVLAAVQALAASSNYVLATPSDSTPLTASTRAISIGGAGNLSVKRPDGTTIGPIPVVAGQTLAIAATYIMATGTTATGILAQF